MGRRKNFRWRSNWGRSHAYVPHRKWPVRFQNRRWWQRLYGRTWWRPILLALILLALWLPSNNGGLAHATFLPWVAEPTEQDPEAAWFLRCTGPAASRYTCVVDGDTIYYRGENIRLQGYDTPELFSPECSEERRMAEQATQMLTDLLNAGPFTLEKPFLSVSTDQYGRALRRLKREGAPLGDQLISAGLAHRYGGGAKQGWCKH